MESDSPRKDGDEGDPPPQKSHGLKRSRTDPNVARIYSSIMKKGKAGYQSLRCKMKDKDKSCTNGSPFKEAGGPEEAEEKEQEQQEEEESVVWEEITESYTLPELPHTPLAVMQINKLIEMEVLEEAHLNLLAMREEVRKQLDESGEGSMIELAKKEKDLNLLYGNLRTKICSLVRDSNSLPSRNKGLLVYVARIIQEEEKRAQDPGGLHGSWMEAWREAVGQGVQVKVDSVHLESREKNTSWLAIHLGLLGKAIVEDLEKVKRELQFSYPRSFNVFSTYVRSYQQVISQHVKKLEKQVTELKDLYALLGWIITGYKSERIMGNVALQPDINEEVTDLQLDEGFLNLLRDKYCSRLREDLRLSLDRVTELENAEVWKERKIPKKEGHLESESHAAMWTENMRQSMDRLDEIEDDWRDEGRTDDSFPVSQIHMDIWTMVKGNVHRAQDIEAQLGEKVISSCLQELSLFPSRFDAAFQSSCSALRRQPLWTTYHVTYINTFSALVEHMEEHQPSCPAELEGFRKAAKKLIDDLLKNVEDKFKEDVQPFLKRMMTRKWLTNDEDFKQLHALTKQVSQHCSRIRPPHGQEFGSRIHYHVVREYVSQLMKNNYSCKNRKHEKAAKKIQDQWDDLREQFENMNSSHEWLYAAGDDLTNIISQKNNKDIKENLRPLVEHYPDFSKKHLVAVLHFRGLPQGREHRRIRRKLQELRRSSSQSGDRNQVLFGNMATTVNADNLSTVACACFSVLRP